MAEKKRVLGFGFDVHLTAFPRGWFEQEPGTRPGDPSSRGLDDFDGGGPCSGKDLLLGDRALGPDPAEERDGPAGERGHAIL